MRRPRRSCPKSSPAWNAPQSSSWPEAAAAAWERGFPSSSASWETRPCWPHLDYRVWKNGTPIDPLKIPSEPAEPISKENRAGFEFVRDRIMAELNGDVKPEERITQLDSLVLPDAAAPAVVSEK